MRVASSWEQHLPKELVQLIDDGNQQDFDALMDANPNEQQKAMLAWRMAPYGTTSYYEAYVKAREQTLDASTVAQIQCPTLVLDPDGEQFWPGQSQQLYDALTCEKQIRHFSAAEGADWHCEPAAQSLRDEVVFDFLETVFAR